MNIMDEFDDARIFEGETPEYLMIGNLDEFVATHGKDYVEGYLHALQIVAVETSAIIYHPNKDLACHDTPHMVKKKLIEFWDHKKRLLDSHLQKFEAMHKKHDTNSPG